MIIVITFALVGVILMVALPKHDKWGRWVGILLLGPFASSIPVSLSLITSNVGGFTKKATVSAMLFIAYCTGNIIGPQLFLTRESPNYPVSIAAITSLRTQSLVMLTLWIYRPASKVFLLDSRWQFSSSSFSTSTIHGRIVDETVSTVQHQKVPATSSQKISSTVPTDNFLDFGTRSE